MLTQEVHDCFNQDCVDANVHKFRFSHLSRLLTVMLTGKIRINENNQKKS